MPTKQQQLADLLIQTTKEVTTNFANWTGFLTTVGNLYKYPFHEQLLIYAQKPEATACAEYSLWNDTMNRYVCRGAKGIGIIDPIQDNPKIKYIFDIVDTGTREKSRRPFLWKMEKHHEQPILAMLQKKFDAKEDTIYDAIDNIANALAKEYYEDNSYSIKHLVADSFLEELDEDSLRVSVENAVAVSLAIHVYSEPAKTRLFCDFLLHRRHQSYGYAILLFIEIHQNKWVFVQGSFSTLQQMRTRQTIELYPKVQGLRITQ